MWLLAFCGNSFAFYAFFFVGHLVCLHCCVAFLWYLRNLFSHLHFSIIDNFCMHLFFVRCSPPLPRWGHWFLYVLLRHALVFQVRGPSCGADLLLAVRRIRSTGVCRERGHDHRLRAGNVGIVECVTRMDSWRHHGLQVFLSYDLLGVGEVLVDRVGQLHLGRGDALEVDGRSRLRSWRFRARVSYLCYVPHAAWTSWTFCVGPWCRSWQAFRTD